jgi:hypothetical protein
MKLTLTRGLALALLLTAKLMLDSGTVWANEVAVPDRILPKINMLSINVLSREPAIIAPYKLELFDQSSQKTVLMLQPGMIEKSTAKWQTVDFLVSNIRNDIATDLYIAYSTLPGNSKDWEPCCLVGNLVLHKQTLEILAGIVQFQQNNVIGNSLLSLPTSLGWLERAIQIAPSRVLVNQESGLLTLTVFGSAQFNETSLEKIEIGGGGIQVKQAHIVSPQQIAFSVYVPPETVPGLYDLTIDTILADGLVETVVAPKLIEVTANNNQPQEIAEWDLKMSKSILFTINLSDLESPRLQGEVYFQALAVPAQILVREHEAIKNRNHRNSNECVAINRLCAKRLI